MKSYKRNRIKNHTEFRLGVVALCEEFEISSSHATTLVKELKGCLNRYNERLAADANHFAADHFPLLQKQRGNVLKLAKFTKAVREGSQKYKNAQQLLEAELAVWASVRSQASDTEREALFLKLEALGFEHAHHKNRENLFQNYGSSVLVSNWLSLNEIMNEVFVRTSSSARKRQREARSKTDRHVTADLKLIGVELPSLYERFVSRQFGISKGGGSAKNVHGVKWVTTCRSLMGLPVASPSKVDAHRRKALELGLAVRPVLRPRAKKQVT